MNLVQHCLYLAKTTYSVLHSTCTNVPNTILHYSTLIHVYSKACTSSTCLYGVLPEAEPPLNFDL